MARALNRTLQVRTADRLRAGLARDELSGLPLIDGLTDDDQRELCDAGGGRLAAIAIRVDVREVDGHPRLPELLDRLGLRAAARLVDGHVRRTDVLGVWQASTLLVLVPGLDPPGGQSMADRLLDLLDHQRVELGAGPAELRVSVGVAFRSAASPLGWATRTLAAEAERSATTTIPPLAAAG